MSGESFGEWSRNTGSAKRLSGKILVLTLFITEKDWPEQEKNILYNMVLEAESWMESLAMRYGKFAKFVNATEGLSTPYFAHIPPDADSKELKDSLVVAYLTKLGVPLDEFCDWAKENFGCSQALLFVVANDLGRGYANKSYNFHPKDCPEAAILYHSALGKMTSADVIHEFLHLFGAIDLYHDWSCGISKEKAESFRLMYPREIMRTTSYPLDELMISPLTAWLIGLSDKKEAWFDEYLK